MGIYINSKLFNDFILKSQDAKNQQKLEYFKKELLKILANKKDDEEETMDKSFMFYVETLEKSGKGLPPGTKKEWPAGSGKWYVKTGKGDWIRTYNGNGRGSAKGMQMSIARMKKAIANAKSLDELYAIVERNKYKFTDDNGHQLPVVKELMETVHDMHTNFKGSSKPAAEPKEVETKTPKAEEKQKIKDEEGSYNQAEDAQDKRIGSAALWEQNVKRAIKTGDAEKIKAAISQVEKEYKELSKKAKPNDKDFLDVELKFRQRDASKALKELAEKDDSADNYRKELNSEKHGYDVAKENIANSKLSDGEIKAAIEFWKNADKEKSDPENHSYAGQLKAYQEELDKRENKEESKNYWIGDIKGNRITIDDAKNRIKTNLSKIDKLKEDFSEKEKSDQYDVIKDINALEDENKHLLDRMKPEDRKEMESEQEKHDNRSLAMMGNQNARKYGLTEEQESQLGDSVDTWTEKEMADHIKAGDFGDEIRNGMEQAAKAQGLSVDTLVADLHREYTEKKRKEYAEKLPEMIKNKAEEYKKDWYVKSSAESIVKKLGEKKLETYAEMNIKDDDEFLKDITAKCQKLEMEGKHIDEYTYGTAVWNHFINKECQRLAREKLDAIHANRTDSGEDIPVKEEDMKEAISIIGSDVDRILSGRDIYGNAKQTLTDKIKRRIRNQPALARAMLVYIQQQQKETGKTVYTPKHSIWMELPKLNENARQSKANGETETKTGTSGNLYEGEDGTYVVENKDWGRYQIFFPGKPDSSVISKLKSHGFRWSPKSGSWVCYNTGNGEYALKQMVGELGLKKPVEKAPVAKDETPKEIEKELKKSPTLDDIKTRYQAAKSVTGNSKTYRLPNGEKIKCHYKLVEADAPTASHDETTYQKTPGFPTDDSGSTVNDRDYSKDIDAQASVRNIAANYSGLAIQDPPIVTKDGIVVSGNNRTMSSKLAAKQGTDKQYLEDLKEEVEDYGIDPDELKNFEHPRLILEQDEEHSGKYTTEEFAKYNQEGKKSMNATEKAVKISKTIKPEVVSDIAGTLSDYDTMAEMWTDRNAAQKVINSLVNGGVIGQNDVAQYFTESAGISESGKEFVETVLIGSVMNENNIRSLSGDGGKAIRQKLVRGIVPLIDNKGMGNEYSFNGELNEAVRIAVAVMKDREHFSSVKDYLDQGNMFESKTDPITGKLAEMIEGMTQKEFAEKMKGLDAGLRPAANGEMDMFLGRCETKEEVMNSFLKIKDTVQKAISRFMKIFA